MWRKHSRTPMDADGYNWRKYGCRVNVAFDARTTYFKCATPGCGAKKRMVTSLHTCRTTGAIMDGETVHVHDGNHTHAPHAPHARAGPNPRILRRVVVDDEAATGWADVAAAMSGGLSPDTPSGADSPKRVAGGGSDGGSDGGAAAPPTAPRARERRGGGGGVAAAATTTTRRGDGGDAAADLANDDASRRRAVRHLREHTARLASAGDAPQPSATAQASLMLAASCAEAVACAFGVARASELRAAAFARVAPPIDIAKALEAAGRRIAELEQRLRMYEGGGGVGGASAMYDGWTNALTLGGMEVVPRLPATAPRDPSAPPPPPPSSRAAFPTEFFAALDKERKRVDRLNEAEEIAVAGGLERLRGRGRKPTPTPTPTPPKPTTTPTRPRSVRGRGKPPREKSLRNGDHHANAVVWEPVYRTRQEVHHADDNGGGNVANALEAAMQRKSTQAAAAAMAAGIISAEVAKTPTPTPPPPPPTTTTNLALTPEPGRTGGPFVVVPKADVGTKRRYSWEMDDGDDGDTGEDGAGAKRGNAPRLGVAAVVS